MKPPYGLTPERARAFCAALAESCNVGKSCHAISISRMTAYTYRNDNPWFAKMWDDAMKAGLTSLEDEAHRRAFEGHQEPVVHHGQFSQKFITDPETGERKPVFDEHGTPVNLTVSKYSDLLATFLLCAHAPEKYRQNSKVEIAGSLNLTSMTSEEIEIELAELAQLEAIRGGATIIKPDYDDLV